MEKDKKYAEVEFIGKSTKERIDTVVAGLSAVAKLKDVNIIVIGQTPDRFDVEILGKKYIMSDLKTTSKYFLSDMFRPIYSVSILKEYELIQLKKSKLSKSKRDLVELKFEMYHTEVK